MANCNIKPYLKEIKYIETAVKNNVPIIGICRGAQLACVMAGGSLQQHIENHPYGFHDILLEDEEGSVILGNSSHHQMMIPPKSAKVLATGGSAIGIGEYNKATNIDKVIEVAYFPSINALGIQPHPEWDDCPQDFIDYCSRKIKEYLL